MRTQGAPEASRKNVDQLLVSLCVVAPDCHRQVVAQPISMLDIGVASI